MNTPIQKAKDRYGKHLEELILHYSTNGLMYSDNQVFLLMQLHNKNLLENENSLKDVDKLDCWYVHYATGNLNRLFEICPYDVEWVAFERGDEPLRFYKLDRIRRLSNG